MHKWVAVGKAPLYRARHPVNTAAGCQVVDRGNTLQLLPACLGCVQLCLLFAKFLGN